MSCIFLFFFFFSSRRRHTRWPRDWSSDVCSSDLIGQDQTVELNGRQVSTLLTYTRHTDPGSNAGIPGVSVPIGMTGDGLPVGLELDGPAGSDRRLLAVARAVERVFGFLPAPKPGHGRSQTD